MEKLRQIPKYRINKIRKAPEQNGLIFRSHGKSSDINDYTDREIIEMLYGIYKYRKFLLVDGNLQIPVILTTQFQFKVSTQFQFKMTI